MGKRRDRRGRDGEGGGLSPKLAAQLLSSFLLTHRNPTLTRFGGKAFGSPGSKIPKCQCPRDPISRLFRENQFTESQLI